jgi:hypothetical protein
LGGLGSGRRWHYGAKGTVESHHSIDVRRWRREGLLTPGRSFVTNWTVGGETTGSINVRSEVGRMVLSYRIRQYDGEWESVDESVLLTTTPGTFGGQLTWFRCPVFGCGRRVARLYAAGRYFACRQCCKLTYASTRENSASRAIRRADKIRDRLGWDPASLTETSGKPRWMRRRTFERLTKQHDQLVQKSMVAMMMKFGPRADFRA